MWPAERVEGLRQLIARLGPARRCRFSFLPSDETTPITYFADDRGLDLARLSGKGFDLIGPSDRAAIIDVLIVTAHGVVDLSPSIWRLRQQLPSTVIAVWFWDNHLSQFRNMRTAQAADFAFPSHWYCAPLLANPCSILGNHIPACSAQWTRNLAASLFNSALSRERSDRVLVNYVDYPFSWRSALLRQLQTEAPETDVKLMPPEDRSRYFAKTPTDRFAEWLQYKASLLLPVDRDLSTRAFDALLAGQVLLVTDLVADFSAVIPPADQERLGIIRLPDLSISTVRRCAAEAIRRYDAGGISAAAERHRFVLDNHMLVNRVDAILETIRQIAAGTLKLSVGGNAQLPFGLYAGR
jgi:hypothetical protein